MPPINPRVQFHIQFSNTTPAPPAGKFNVKWQHDALDPTNISAYVDAVPGISGTTNYVAKFTGSTAIGNSSIFDDGTIVKTVINNNGATYLQVENDHAAASTVQAALVAQLGSGGTGNIFLGVTSSSFTTAAGIPASAGYLAVGSGQTAGLYVQALAGDIHWMLGDGSSISMTLNGSSQLLPHAANSMDIGSLSVPWQTGWFGSNVVANGGFFMRISSFNRAVASPSSDTLQFGDATASTWTEMDFYLSSGTPVMKLTSDLHIVTGNIYVDANNNGVIFGTTESISAAHGSSVSIAVASNVQFTVDSSNGSGDNSNSPLLIYWNSVTKRVIVGPTDSGGTGYRMLKITN